MNLPPALAGRLRAAGHEALHVLEAGLGNLPDQQIFEHAAQENRVVVTLDLDFGEIAALRREFACGVVLLRLRSTTLPHLWDRLHVGIAEGADALDAGAIVLVEDGRVRIRRMPT